MMGIVLSYRRPSNTVLLEVKLPLLATNVEEDGIGNTHCQLLTIFSVLEREKGRERGGGGGGEREREREGE